MQALTAGHQRPLGTDTSPTSTAGGRFQTGVVSVADSSLLDYETATSHSVTVTATSDDGSTSTQSFSVSLTDDTSESSVGAVSDSNACRQLSLRECGERHRRRGHRPWRPTPTSRTTVSL